MRITLEFTKQQASVFSEVLNETIRVLSLQEAVVKDALEKVMTPKEEMNMQTFLANSASQRILCAEILHTVMKADKDTRIITP
jgi:molybdopterin-biosynthesis enzyme MoeA-like protein